MTEPTFSDDLSNDLSDQEGLPGELGTPEEAAGSGSELDPETATDEQ